MALGHLSLFYFSKNMNIKNRVQKRMKVNKLILIKCLSITLVLGFTSCKTTNQKMTPTPISCHLNSGSGTTIVKEDGTFIAHKAMSPLVIDGCNKDSIWTRVDWYAMNYV